MKFLHYLYVITLTASSNVLGQEDEETERISVTLQLADFDLSDAYDDVAEATKYSLLGHGFKNKVCILNTNRPYIHIFDIIYEFNQK